MSTIKKNYYRDEKSSPMTRLLRDIDGSFLSSQYHVETLRVPDKKEEIVISFHGPEDPYQIIYHLVYDELASNGKQESKGAFLRKESPRHAQNVLTKHFRRVLDRNFNKRCQKRGAQQHLPFAC